ncbi:hypothetical protein PQU92_02265 [Asticcacaulis sp. BYS171W]|uniref:DUF998 domain-containing protein n=1 Tax=Asticcacaulis aquaticus TaxID=2984212 RepID=A0ABT5HPT3_9CAUL|nr:hypothetical protein [Asticcacaulis aquaticus]MDC7682080.1 hypothetical protein [Asticcacaulis aquaticus]
MILALALAAFGYARTLPHMTDRTAFEAGAAAIEAQSSPQDYEAYDRLYETYATPRNQIKRISLTLAAVAAGAILLFHRGLNGLISPANKWLIIPVGLIASGLTAWGAIQDVEELYGMAIIPFWSGADAATARGVVFGIFPMTLLLVGLNAVFLIGQKFNFRTRLIPINLRKANLFILGELIITAGMTLYAAWYLNYCSLLSAPLWFYFYGSILAIRAQAHGSADRRVA